MEEKKIIQLKQGLTTAFINYSHASNLAYKPQFISNNYKEGRKVISSVEDELLNCEEFAISVAFITMGGITPLLQTLRELKYRGVRGKILTTDYLTFSEPEALRKLAQFENLELKMFVTENRKEGFHTKGYIFKKEEIYRIIVGSSNMTSSALTTNREWNTKIVSTEQGEYTHNVVEEFDQLWNSEQVLPFEEFIERYTDTYTRNKVIQKQKKLARETEIPSLEVYRLQPNSMQVGFINNLQKIYEAGENRALLISATGTGKTYASAFAMRELGFQRVLFLVHRNQIAKQAMKSYRKVFGGQVVMGMVTGKHQKYDADFVFATIQTLSKDEILEKYGKTAFDAIVIDEAHHSAANSYKKVMDYFHPKLWLGMTATPDKRDDNLDGRNIYEIFNHQIAYEIRLQDAMEEDLLCPFHYFGITDLEVIADAGKSKQDKIENFQYLTSDERALNVMKQAEFFGYSGERVKGLIFCSRIDEARILSEKFNSKGWRTLVLSGNDSEETRVEAIERLAGDEREDALDYIISVDIFSEGVDVPEINQVIMLRPTESPIVFIQQLGRGLRKAEEKEYVVVLDFIGNYRNNFMIPIALSGDLSYNKDNIRRYVTEGGRVIPGASTIHFDEVSRKRIFQAIDNANFSDIINKSTYNRRERPVYGHCGWSRGRFYYRITTFEGRPWDARDPHKTTFMALKHAIRLSIWRKQKETPGVEKAPGVSSPQRKESGRSGRDDGELRFGVRPGHPRKAVTSISQAEALAHGLTHLHHLVFAAVLARELDWCAALQDAREDARPWGVVGIGLRSDVWVEVRRDNHRSAVLVTRVDDVVDMPHDVIGAAVRPQVVDDEEVILEEARLRLLALVERHRLDVGHDVLHAGLQRGEPEVDDPVGDCRGIERLTCAHLSPEEQPIHVIA